MSILYCIFVVQCTFCAAKLGDIRDILSSVIVIKWNKMQHYLTFSTTFTRIGWFLGRRFKNLVKNQFVRRMYFWFWYKWYVSWHDDEMFFFLHLVFIIIIISICFHKYIRTAKKHAKSFVLHFPDEYQIKWYDDVWLTLFSWWYDASGSMMMLVRYIINSVWWKVYTHLFV